MEININEKMKEKKEEKHEIELRPLTIENAKPGQMLVIKPSIEIIKFIIDSMHQYGVRAQIVEATAKDGSKSLFVQGIINIQAHVEDIVEHEEVFIFPEKDEKQGE